MNLKLTPIRFGIAVLFLVATVYHGRGYYLLTVHETTPEHDLNMRWREQQSIICGATVHLKGQRITREQQEALVPKYGFRVESNPSRGGYPPWSFLPGYVFYGLPWPLTRIWFALLNLTLTAGIVVWLRRASRFQFERPTVSASLLPIAAILAVSGFTRTLSMGQYGIICVASLVGALVLAEAPGKRADIGAGVLLGLALSKPSLAIPFLIPFLFRRRWLTLCTCAMYLIIATLVIWWTSGVDPVTMFGKIGDAVYYSAGQGQEPVAKAVTSGVDPVWAIRVTAIAVMGMFSWLVYRSPKLAWIELFAGASVASRLWTYHRSYDDVILVFLLAVLVMKAMRSPDRITVGCFLTTGLSLWIPAHIEIVLPGIYVVQMSIWVTALVVIFRYAPLDESTRHKLEFPSGNSPSVECPGGV